MSVGEVIAGSKRNLAVVASTLGLMSLYGCGEDPSYVKVNASSIDDATQVVSPYSDADHYNFIDEPKTHIRYSNDGSRTFTVRTDEGETRVKEECDPADSTLYTVLPYKSVFKLYWGFKYNYPKCADGQLSPSEFPANK